MKPAQDRLAPELRALPARDPSVPVVANVDAAPKTDGPSAIDALVRAGLGAGALGRGRAHGLRLRASARMLKWVPGRC